MTTYVANIINKENNGKIFSVVVSGNNWDEVHEKLYPYLKEKGFSFKKYHVSYDEVPNLG